MITTFKYVNLASIPIIDDNILPRRANKSILRGIDIIYAAECLEARCRTLGLGYHTYSYSRALESDILNHMYNRYNQLMEALNSGNNNNNGRFINNTVTDTYDLTSGQWIWPITLNSITSPSTTILRNTFLSELYTELDKCKAVYLWAWKWDSGFCLASELGNYRYWNFTSDEWSDSQKTEAYNSLVNLWDDSCLLVVPYVIYSSNYKTKFIIGMYNQVPNHFAPSLPSTVSEDYLHKWVYPLHITTYKAINGNGEYRHTNLYLPITSDLLGENRIDGTKRYNYVANKYDSVPYELDSGRISYNMLQNTYNRLIGRMDSSICW